MDMHVPEKWGNIDWPHGGKISSVKIRKFQSRLAGAVTGLDDERFLDEYGKKRPLGAF